MGRVDVVRRFATSRARLDAIGIGALVAAVAAVGRWWVRDGGDPIFWG